MGEHYDIGGGRERYMADKAKRFRESNKLLEHTINLNLKAAVESAQRRKKMTHYEDDRSTYEAGIKSKANEKQVGGKHYKSGYQHWDLVLDFGLHYLEGCSTKYVTRRKGSRGEDIGKAIHYIEKLMEELTARNFPIRIEGRLSKETDSFREMKLKEYALANNLTFREHVIIKNIVYHMDYDQALAHMKELQKEV
jgi:hypothetical protein